MVLALALVVAGCWGDDASVVEAARVASAEVTETVSAPASVEAAASQEVTAEVAGRVADLGISDGDAVSAGEVVVRLESPQLDAALEEADEALAGLERTPDVEAAANVSIDPPPEPENPARSAVAELDASVRPRLEEARQRVEDARRRLDEATDALPDEAADALPDEAADALPDEVDERLPDASAAETPITEASAALDALEATYQGVRDALLAAGQAAVAQQRELSAQLTDSLAEAQQAIGTAVADVNQQVTEAQRAQIDATRQEVESRREALVVEAPIGGVVEIGRGGPGLDALGALGGDALGGLGAGQGLGAIEEGGAGLGDVGDVPGGQRSGADDEPLTEGAAVAPGQPLFRVLDLSEWYVEADVDEVDAPAVVEGQRATVLIDAFPDQEFEGIVESVALTAERGLTGGVAFPTRIRVIDPPQDPGPRVGMTASVEIATETVEADLAVPTRAVVRRDEGTAVYAVRDGVAELVVVDVLAQGDELTAVDADLEPGERVVVAGYEGLADGARVRVEQGR